MKGVDWMKLPSASDRQLAALVRGDGGAPREVVMVSSGAIAEGMKRLGWTATPGSPQLQAAAAVEMGLAQMYETKLREQAWVARRCCSPMPTWPIASVISMPTSRCGGCGAGDQQKRHGGQ